MDKQRILFVDDEPAVLDGLRNALHKDRARWNMAFACGGEAALEELSTSRFHVVVSDMRMPGMDGARLLRRVTERYPWIARIVLSGQAEPAAVADVLPVMNQFLAKPCRATDLRSAIERGCRLGALLNELRGEPEPRTSAAAGGLPGAVALLCPVCRRCEAFEVPPRGVADLDAGGWGAPCPGHGGVECGSSRTITFLPAAEAPCDFVSLLRCEASRCPQRARTSAP